MKRFLIIGVAVAVLLSGCGVNQALVRAFADYHAATAPEYCRYVEADGTLTIEEKSRRFATVDDAGRVIQAAITGR